MSQPPRNESLVRQTRQMTPKKLAPDFVFKEECYAIIGACFEVYKDKGCGFYEPVYQECLGIDFENCRIRPSRNRHWVWDIDGGFASRNTFAVLSARDNVTST